MANEANRIYLNGLKNDHKAVVAFLEDIKRFEDFRDLQGIASRVTSLKNGLVAHLKKEDDKIYPELLTHAREKNLELVSITINTFSTAMKGIASRAIIFFGKYPGSEDIGRQSAEFSKDFQAVYEDIRSRVEREEKTLYPMYEKYCC